jgi:O-succinylbenzoate synthase
MRVDRGLDGARPLDVRAVELIEIGLPLARSFRSNVVGMEGARRTILVAVHADGARGWGECAAMAAPSYTAEWLDGAWLLLTSVLVPRLLSGGPIASLADLERRLSWLRGNRFARAGLELAVLDAMLRREGVALSAFLGAERRAVPCGVSVGLSGGLDALLEEVAGYVALGYRRVKLKIGPGHDVEVARAVREAHPDVPLSVDANGAYSLAEAESVLPALDALELVMIEQPLDAGDLVMHARLQRRLATPICLDESVRSAADAEAAISLGACRVVNVKPGRVGGVLESARIHDVARAAGVDAWIGGMFESGVGRAANLALAAMPGVTLPGDTSASERYFVEDVTPPFRLEAGGVMAVPSGPGIGVEPDVAAVRRLTRRRVVIEAPRAP